MKQTLTLSLLLALLCMNVALADKNKEEVQLIPIGKTASSEQINAASSPWFPLNLENATSQYKVADFYKNGTIVTAGGKTTAPMLGNYFGYYSKDSGKTFTRFSFPNFQSSGTSTSLRFAGIASWGDSVMINADYNGYLIRSTNWGVKWDTVSTIYGTGAFYDGVKFISRDTVIAYGDAVDTTMFIIRSTDRGATWNRVTVSAKLTPEFGTYVFASAGSKTIATFGNTVWMNCYITSGNNAPGILKSTDAGVTWSFIAPANFAAKRKWTFTNFSFKDANVGYGLVSNSYVLSIHKTTDGGVTWGDTISVGGPTANVLTQQPVQIQALPGTGIVYMSGFDGVNPASWKSTDDGATWTKLVTPPNTGTQASLSNISFLSENVGVGAGTRQALLFTPTVEVKFLVNTATVPDTIKSTSTVQMRGDDGNLLRWDGGSSVRFTNITNPAGSSDYWQVSARFKVGQAAFPYKIFTNVNANVGSGHAQEHNGWEKDITDFGNGNRQLIVGQNDTTIKLQFVNGSPNNQTQFWRPYTESDSMEVTFRVNMANVEDFNPATMKMGIRGSQLPLEWGKTIFLNREQNDGNNPTRYAGGNFWSATVKVPIATPYAGNDTNTVYYKFVQHLNTHTATTDPVKWEDGIVRTNAFDIEPGGGSNPARIFRIHKGSGDTTLYWKWWANQGVKPPLGSDTAFVTFRVNMLKAINSNSYTIGDTVQVRHGFANSGSTVKTKNLARLGSTFIYTATDTVYGTKIDSTKNLVYQYYLVKGGIDIREVYYNFEYTGTDVSLAERRLLAMKTKTLTAADTSSDPKKATRQPFWRNTRKLSQVVNVKFTVDLRPAFFQVRDGQNGKDTLVDIQGSWTITKSVLDSIYKWGVSINGPATGGWATWGSSLYADTSRKMYDDGTKGDLVAGDRIYSRQYVFGPDSVGGRNLVGQEFKFGIRGGDNEGGKGGFGNNHIENINDGSSSTTIASYFGSINPAYYDRFNFETGQPLLNVRQDESGLPKVFALEQNYPNPFNPSTSIKYSIPVSGLVTLKIFNILGQEVATLVNEALEAGSYTASFNASTLSSGVYLYKIESGSFTSVKKMMLLK